MIPYIYASELKKKYMVYGSFYNILITDQKNERIPCRNLLEIYDRNYFKANGFKTAIEANELSTIRHENTPDAIFIMMNPGSSKPIQQDYVIPNFVNNSHLPQNILTNPIVLTRPDNAQYQIMNVMDYKKWKHIRVLNLSDIREAKSSAFMDKVITLNSDVHTIFSKIRAIELHKAIPNPNILVVAAWGRDKRLIPLAMKCLSALHTASQPKGVQYPGEDPCLYAYASPPLKKYKMQWLERLQKIVDL